MEIKLSRLETLTLTADEIAMRVRQKHPSVVGVVKSMLQRIEQNNQNGRKLRAIISVAPRDTVVDLAAKLDQEMIDGKDSG